jgi:hypothetical protein
MMSRSRVALFVITLFAVGCGGRIFDADGGTSNPDGSPNPTPTSPDASPIPHPPPFDAGPPTPPPPVLCSPMSGSGTVSTNGCSLTEDWSCGNTQYTVLCNCPSAQCTCVQSGTGKWQVQYANGCPSCTASGKQLAQLCGFPSQ